MTKTIAVTILAVIVLLAGAAVVLAQTAPVTGHGPVPAWHHGGGDPENGYGDTCYDSRDEAGGHWQEMDEHMQDGTWEEHHRDDGHYRDHERGGNTGDDAATGRPGASTYGPTGHMGDTGSGPYYGHMGW